MPITDKLLLSDIAQTLGTHSPKIQTPHDRGHAAVAMLLREEKGFPEMLFIVRAKHDHDPWSGNIGFPGGRLNPAGESAQQAAERETLEELSLDLSESRYLGRLDDLYGAIMPVLVSCFVYQLVQPANMKPNHEVADIFWCPLVKLLDAQRQQYRSFHYRGMERIHPVVELLEPHEPFLWGITYRLIRNFFSLCDFEFGLPERPHESS